MGANRGRGNYSDSGCRREVSFSFAVAHISLPRRRGVEMGTVISQIPMNLMKTEHADKKKLLSLRSLNPWKKI